MIICGPRACKRVGAHQSFAISGALQFLGAPVVCDFVSFAVLVFVCDNLWSSSVHHTCRRAKVVRDLVNFAIRAFACGNLCFSSVQTCRRTQVLRDLVSVAIFVLVCDSLWSSSLQTCRRAQVMEIQLHQASRRRVRTYERNDTISWLDLPPTSGLGSFAIFVFGLGSGVH